MSANVCGYVTSPKKPVLYVSPAYETLWCRPAKSLYESPQSWFEAIHPEDRERVQQAALALRATSIYDEEFRIVRPDGTVRWVRDRAFPVRDSAGLADQVVGVTQDVTVHKEAEAEQLHRSERRFRLLIEHASDLITVLNVGGLIRFQSPSLERVLGYAPTELLGRSVFEFVPPEDRRLGCHLSGCFLNRRRRFRSNAASAIRTANGEYCSPAVERYPADGGEA